MVEFRKQTQDQRREDFVLEKRKAASSEPKNRRLYFKNIWFLDEKKWFYMFMRKSFFIKKY